MKDPLTRLVHILGVYQSSQNVKKTRKTVLCTKGSKNSEWVKAREGIEDITLQSNNESDTGWQNYHELILLTKIQGWMKTLNIKLFAMLLDKEYYKIAYLNAKRIYPSSGTVLAFMVNTFTVANNSHSMISEEGVT